MDRQEYIKLAQFAGSKFAIYGSDWEKAEWKDSELVKYEDSKYIPFAYILTFRKDGIPFHGVRIRALKVNSVVETGLDKISKVEEQAK